MLSGVSVLHLVVVMEIEGRGEAASEKTSPSPYLHNLPDDLSLWLLWPDWLWFYPKLWCLYLGHLRIKLGRVFDFPFISLWMWAKFSHVFFFPPPCLVVSMWMAEVSISIFYIRCGWRIYGVVVFFWGLVSMYLISALVKSPGVISQLKDDFIRVLSGALVPHLSTLAASQDLTLKLFSLRCTSSPLVQR